MLDYRDSITFHKPDAVPEDQRPKRAQELTAEFCAALLDRGLIVEAAGNGGGVSIIDPSIDREFFDSNQASVEARAAVKAYERDNAESLEAERRKADALKVKEAIDSGDGDRIREALSIGKD